MNKVMIYVSVLVAALLVVVFLPIINDQVEALEFNYHEETFTATQDNLTQEVVTLSYTLTGEQPFVVEVNDVVIDSANYTAVGTTVTLNADQSNIGDTIDVLYYSVDEWNTSIVPLLHILPLIVVTVLVAGVAIKYVFLKD